MQLDIRKIDQRIKIFVDYFIAYISSDPNRHFLALQSKCQSFNDIEEKLFFIFLVTHFDSTTLANEFHQRLSWHNIHQMDEKDILNMCQEYIQGKRFIGQYLIGDHRRYFRCLTNDQKVDYCTDIFTSYKQVIERQGTQAEYFEIENEAAEFDKLYQKMKEIKYFHRRLPRFDHLERLSRLHHFYLVPERIYAEYSSGPLNGITCLLFGKKFGRENGITKRYLVKDFPQIWNEKIGEIYTIPDDADFKKVILYLEKWVVNRVRNWESLPFARRNDNAFLFDIESCLCNWQKGKYLESS